MEERGRAFELRVGLCADCRHARRIESGRGSVFWMCRRSERDPRFRQYPPLPVLRCGGHESEADDRKEEATKGEEPPVS